MLGIFGILDVMETCINYMESDLYPITNKEINEFLGFPDDVNPLAYLNEKRDEAYELWFHVNPKTGKYWTALEIVKEIGLMK